MIFNAIRIIKHSDLSALAWSGLSRFQNAGYVAQHVANIQKISISSRSNLDKQARQVRYCVTQAKEYFSSSREVSLATRPLLMYYGMMSLALAEILVKQTGMSSLDKARGQHAHHGLDLAVSGSPSKMESLENSASALRAKPLVRSNGERFGTFELWHQSSRETPVCGKARQEHSAFAITENSNIILNAIDTRPQVLPLGGISLLDCFYNIPSMLPLINNLGLQGSIARARMSLVRKLDLSTYYSMVVHPTYPDIIAAVERGLTFDASMVNHINGDEIPNGYVLNWTLPPDQAFKLSFSFAMQEDVDNIYFCAANSCLIELGFFYVGLYILGNYARYYPDQWMVDVESSSQLALAAHEFLSAAQTRVPILSLSELSRQWILTE